MTWTTKTHGVIFTFLLAAAFVIAGCEESNTPQQTAKKVEAVKNGLVSVRYTSTVWPPVGPKNERIALAENPLAKNYLVVLDGSGSMDWQSCFGKTNRTTIAKGALEKWIGIVPKDANIGLVVFDNRGILEHVSLGNGEANRSKFVKEVRGAGADSGTPLHSAMLLGYELLGKQARRQRGYGEYNLVVVTDGEANGGEDPSRLVQEIMATSPITITTIGFCIGQSHSLNQPGFTVYKEAGNLEELKKGLAEVLAESPTFDVKDFK